MTGELRIDEYDADTLAAEAGLEVGGPRPRPLAFWREVLARTGGYIPGFEGEQFAVSLDRWADADENTMLAIYVRWVDPSKVGTVDPLGKPSA